MERQCWEPTQKVPFLQLHTNCKKCVDFLLIEGITSENYTEGNVKDLPYKWSALLEGDRLLARILCT